MLLQTIWSQYKLDNFSHDQNVPTWVLNSHRLWPLHKQMIQTSIYLKLSLLSPSESILSLNLHCSLSFLPLWSLDLVLQRFKYLWNMDNIGILSHADLFHWKSVCWDGIWPDHSRPKNVWLKVYSNLHCPGSGWPPGSVTERRTEKKKVGGHPKKKTLCTWKQLRGKLFPKEFSNN